ncbi:MAG: helix-turn-helix domain-containing protein [Rhodopirellula sp. JB053]
MIDPILDRWEYTARDRSRAIVLPDGCRDLIVRWSRDEQPHWFLTSLDASSRTVESEVGVSMRGYRLRPGVEVDERRLMGAAESRDPHAEAMVDAIESCTKLNRNVAETLAALASSNSVEQATQSLSVGKRTLQRLVANCTGKTPLFWLQLARVRHAAQRLNDGNSLVSIANETGYSDQPHMTRQFKRWFGVTPRQFAADARLTGLIAEPGYV